jgi:hypothetical protein
MFRPGEGTTKQWYSRLCGLKQLTRVSDTDLRPNSMLKASQIVKEPKITVPKIEQQDNSSLQQLTRKQSFEDVTTSEYTLKQGIYSCNLCNMFRTGSSLSMKAHIEEFHFKKTQVIEPKLGQEETEGEKVSVSSKASASQFVTEDKEEVRSSIPRQEVVKEQQEELFICQRPACGKAFKSKRALTMHETRMHR